MLSKHKLHTFIFRDKYRLTPEEVSLEAREAGLRRADMMGWSVMPFS